VEVNFVPMISIGRQRILIHTLCKDSD
jgi:hypothetical protein